MSQTLHKNNQEEWLEVLGKGMITLPKKWRDDMGIENGDIKARKEGNKVVIESKPQSKPTAPYRVYTTAEINEFLEEDSLPDELAQKVQNMLARDPSTSLLAAFVSGAATIGPEIIHEVV